MLFSSSEQTCCTLVIWLWMSDCSFTLCVLIIKKKKKAISTKVVYLQCCLVVTWLVPCENAAAWAHVLCTPYGQGSVYRVRLFKATYVGCVSLAVNQHTCIFGRMPRIFYVLLRYVCCVPNWSAVRYWNKSQHRKLTQEKKILLTPAFLAECPGSFRCCHANVGVEQTLK